MGDARADELLQPDNAEKVSEQPDLRAVVHRDEVVRVDRVGHAIADHAHVAIDDRLARDQDVETGFLAEGGDAGSVRGHGCDVGVLTECPQPRGVY
jgi:hypothetical protein